MNCTELNEPKGILRNNIVHIGQHISCSQRVPDNDADYTGPLHMLAELRNDSKTLAARLRDAPNITAGQQDR